MKREDLGRRTSKNYSRNQRKTAVWRVQFKADLWVKGKYKSWLWTRIIESWSRVFINCSKRQGEWWIAKLRARRSRSQWSSESFIIQSDQEGQIYPFVDRWYWDNANWYNADWYDANSSCISFGTIVLFTSHRTSNSQRGHWPRWTTTWARKISWKLANS